MKVKTEDILKPGAVLEVKLIDWNDPQVKKRVSIHNAECNKLKRMSYRYPKYY